MTDISYYFEPVAYSFHAPSPFWTVWRDAAVGNHPARIPDPIVIQGPAVIGRDTGWRIVEDEQIPPDRFMLANEDFCYELRVYAPEYVQEPIVWREECQMRNGVERWLLRVEQPQKILDAAGNEVPYGDPDLEWL
jgi:hypothetical protein